MQHHQQPERRGAEMPADLRQLLTTGMLLPDADDPHAVQCATCGLPVALLLNRPPGLGEGGTVWGKDVSVVCPCCSFAHCTHGKGRTP